MLGYKPGEDIFTGRHSFICGATQQGKTHFVAKRMNQIKRPILFFNPQREELGSHWIDADARHDSDLIIKALKNGSKISYVPSKKNQRAAVELAILVNELFEAGIKKSNPILLVVDECHVAQKHRAGAESVEMVATRGISWGINGVFITQRPAYAHKAAYTMADLHVMFRTNMERSYFQSKGIPYKDYTQMISQGGKYSYAVLDYVTMTGPYKE